MKHRVFLIAAFALALAIPQSVKAYDFSYTHQGKTLFYTITDSYQYYVSVSNPSGSGSYAYISGNVVVPDSVEYNGVIYAVETIANYAFYGCSGLTSIVIPNKITSIGDYAFQGCNNLTTISMPDSVIYIGNGAFQGCSNLTAVSIGNKCTYIGSKAFGNCSNLNMASIYGDGASIEYEAFYACTALTTVTLGEGVASIGNFAFNLCSGLTSIIIPDGVTSIGERAFNGCSSLLSITIGNDVSSIGAEAFNVGCYNISSIVVAEGNTHFDSRDSCNAIIQTDLNLLVKGCNSTVIPNSVTAIGSFAFEDCRNLTSITIPDAVTSIGNNAFCYCEKLKSVTIPSNVAFIGAYAFSSCDSLTTIFCKADNPAVCGQCCFGTGSYTYNHNIRIYVPCESLSEYQNASVWNGYSPVIYGVPYELDSTYTFFPNSDSMGRVYVSMANCDSNVTVTAESYDGFRLVGWSDGEIGNPRVFHLTGDTSVAAVFASYSFLSNNDNMGEISTVPEEYYSDVTVTATPYTGFQLVGWSDGGTGNPRTFCLTGDTLVYALFDYIPYAITGSAQVPAINADFEVPTLDERWSVYNDYPDFVNQWYINTLDDTNRALFISNNGGVSNTYTTTGNYYWPRSFAYTSALLSAGDYYYGFDWRCQGEVGHDGFVVALLPDSVVYSSSLWTSSIMLSGNTKLYGQSMWQSRSGIVSVPADGVYKLVFLWSNDQSAGSNPAAAVDNVILFKKDDSSSAGIVYGNDTVHYGDSAMLTAEANYGYHFTQWEDGDTANHRIVIATEDEHHVAVFARNLYSIINADTSTNGTITGTGTYEYLNNRTIIAIPNYGYHFTQWSDGDTNNPRTLILTQDTAFTALFDNNLYAVSALSADTVMGTSAGSDSIAYLDSVTLTATPNYGYHFTQWSDGNTDNPRMVQVTRDSMFTAQFDYNQYDIALTVDTAIHGSVSGAGSYNYLSSRTLTATPNYGYHFTQWNDGDTNNPRTLTLTQDTAFTALFTENLYYVTATCNDTSRGTVLGSGSVAYLDTITLIVVPNYGYHLNYWRYLSDSGSYVTMYGTDTIQLVVTRNMSVTAYFTYNQYDIALTVDTAIHGSVSGAGSYNYLSSRTLTATPNYGYHFTQWSDGDTNNPRTITLTQDTAFTALFEKNSYIITVLSADTVMGAASGVPLSPSDSSPASGEQVTLAYLNTVSVSATANYGYHFTQWSDGNTDNPRMVQVTRDSMFTAQFDYNQYDIALTVDTAIHGSVSGAGSYNYLSTCTVAATPNYGYYFTQWSDGNTNNPRTLTLTQDTSFTALFAKNLYTLTLQSNDTSLGEVLAIPLNSSDSSTASGEQLTVEYLDIVSITATVTAPHHHFVRWSDGSTEAVRTLVLTCDSMITALFAIDTHTVTLAVNDDLYGTVTAVPLWPSATSPEAGEGQMAVPYGADVAISANAAEGFHFAQWSNGSRENPYTITVTSDTALTAVFTDDVVPEICMVTVQEGRNVLLWQKELEVEAYNIYREGSVTDQYELVATVPYDSLSTWMDTASRPATHSYRYRLSATDLYGYESEQGAMHKTMHLTISQGIGNRWNLVWTPYEGADYNTYVIYRGTNASDIRQIDVMAAGGNTSYTDEESTAGEVYYQVGVMMSNPCTPTKAASISLSNIATNSTVGIGEVGGQDPEVRVYVADGKIVVEGAEGEMVRVFNVIGQPVDGASLPAGVYMVKVGDRPARKVVVVR